MLFRLILGIAAFSVLVSGSARAEMPRNFIIQGVLADSNGARLNGPRQIVARLYEANSGGTAIYADTDTIAVNNGLFVMTVGDGLGIPDTVPMDHLLYVGLQVESDPEMTPRMALRVAPFAMGLALPIAADTNNAATALSIKTTGTGRAGDFRVDNAASLAHGLSVTTTGMGRAGSFLIDNTTNPQSAVFGETSGTGSGVYAYSRGSGAALKAATVSDGYAAEIFINNTNSLSNALYVHTNGKDEAIMAESASGDAIRGRAHGPGTALAGVADAGGLAVYAFNPSGDAIMASGRCVLNGNVVIAGNMKASTKDFQIDHPLDPANKYLVHSTIESDKRLNLYAGTVTTDGNGAATVTLPDWFEALNGEIRYQLTCIGQFAQAIIGEELHDGRFTIRTDKPNVKVSWQVTGVRQDAYARAHPMEVEVDKGENRGKYLTPIEHGQPPSAGLISAEPLPE